jgi:hypothetical protein
MSFVVADLPAAIRRRVTTTGDCWVVSGWTTGPKGNEYPGYRPPGRRNANGGRLTVRVHRWVYEVLVGPVPDGLVVEHLCEERRCCNPAHLEVVTQRVNVLRGRSPQALNERKTECPRGHRYDYVDPRGYRGCKRCRADAERRRRARGGRR